MNKQYPALKYNRAYLLCTEITKQHLNNQMYVLNVCSWVGNPQKKKYDQKQYTTGAQDMMVRIYPYQTIST